MITEYDHIREELESLAEPDFLKFTIKLLPTVDPTKVLGVRLPKLRKIAKKIGKGDWRSYLETAKDDSFEEIMLQGMVIGEIKEPFDKVQKLIERFVPKINNWSVCDSFCSGLKIAKQYPEEMWDLIKSYEKSKEPYEIRFAVVMMTDYYIDKEHLEDCFKCFDRISNPDYYVKMAVAWAISICFIKFPDETMDYLDHNKLDLNTYNKALQKIIESQRTDPETKQMIKKMKRG